MRDLGEGLRDEIASGNCVVVVGTGVSTATTRNPRASWVGLLESGLEHASRLRTIDDAEINRCRDLLQSGTTQDLMAAADRVVGALGGPDGGEFRQWLREDAGYLSSGTSINDPSVIEAVGGLDLPIMTTNYDDLLEKVLGRDYITWKQPAEMQRWSRGATSDILHLHGHWKYPESIVLTNAQYARLQADDSVNALRQATAATRAMIFIGFGEGLSDPSFGTLRAWIQEVVPFGLRHYRLCRESELDRLTDLHRDEDIWPVSYGVEHADLAGFLTGLAPDLVDQGNTPTVAFASIEDQVRESAVLTPHVRDGDEARISDLLVRPVLLPVPNEQVAASARSRQAEGRVQRCDLQEELANSHTLIAGEEHSGVTSALLWMCSEIYLDSKHLIPLTVDYLQLAGGPTPLRKRVVKQLRLLGYSLRERDVLPPMILVLDNVNAVNQTRLERVARELEDPAFERVLMGCRAGNETLIAALLSSERYNFKIRYAGRLGRADVRGLAELVDRNRSRQLAQQAARVVQTHGLAGTPFTLSMVLSALLKGESLMAASSPTSLLDAYVELLLGRGAAADDPRFGLDSVNKAHILGRLSEVFVNARVGSVPEVVVLGELTNILDTYGWSGDASSILADFVDRRVLTMRNREVSFSQSSYLYLFAAKRAQQDKAFLDLLREDPLFLAPMLAHYAALARSDFALVQDLVPSLLAPFLELGVAKSGLFVEGEPSDAIEESSSELEARLAREAAATPRDDDDEDEFEPLGRDPRDPDVPFPLQPVDTRPTVPRAIVTLGLVSNLVRDTEIVEDQQARRACFSDVLRTWGVLVDLVEQDDFYLDAARDAAREWARQIGVPQRALERFVDDITRMIPLSVALGGISATLSSSKLTRLIDACAEDPEFASDPVLLVMANHILFDVHASGWTVLLNEISERYARLPVVHSILMRMAFFSYVRRPQDAEDERRLKEFLVDQFVSGADGRAPARREHAITALERAKLLASKGDAEVQGTIEGLNVDPEE